MAIDKNGLSNLLAILRPQNNMSALREQRASLLQKLHQTTVTGKQQQGLATKHDIQQLVLVDRQIAQEMYDETYRKLETERLEREAAFAKKERSRERALAKHERLLTNRSISKLLLAADKASHPGGAYTGAIISGSQGDTNYVSNVDRDLQESVQYGIAAAEVAVRRKNSEAKARIEESVEKRQATQRKKTKRVNLLV